MSRAPGLRALRKLPEHLGQLTAELAARWGDRPAIDSPERVPGLDVGPTWSYAAVEDAVARLAAAHAAHGVGEGQRVALLLGSRLDTVLHVLALARLGAAAVPVNPRLGADALAAVLAAAGAARVICRDLEAPGDLPASVDRLAAGPRDRADTLASWLDAHPTRRIHASPRDPDEVSVLLCTSGTTGVPKAAALTSRGLLGGTSILGRFAPLLRVRREPWGLLAALPLYHVFGLSVGLASLCAGLLWRQRPRFQVAEILASLEAGEAAVFVGVPTMYADLEAAGAPDRDLSAVHAWVSAADAMPPERARRFQGYGSLARVAGRGIGSAAFLDVYGMVELSGGAAVRLYPPSPTRPLPGGVPAVLLPGTEARVVDSARQPLRMGQRGELEIRSTGVLKRYEGHADAGPDSEGWFATGDFARRGPARTLWLAGRRRDRLKVAGFSVFPAEIEAVLAGHPGVGEVAVAGVPDSRLGEAVVALVVLRHGGCGVADLEGWARERLAGYMRPRHVAVVDAIPRGPNGKIDRAAATIQALEATTRSSGPRIRY